MIQNIEYTNHLFVEKVSHKLFLIFLEVVVQFKRDSYSVRENEKPAVEIELSRGGVTEPTTIQ